MKVLYTFGEAVGSATVMQEGIFHNDNGVMYILKQDGEKILLTNLKSVETYEMGPINHMIKAKLRSNTIIFTAYRLYLKIGTGFAINNYSKNKQIEALLESNII